LGRRLYETMLCWETAPSGLTEPVGGAGTEHPDR
jgi:hypothetical protein